MNPNAETPPGAGRPGVSTGAAVAVLALGGAGIIAALALWRLDPWGERGNGLPESFQYDLEAYQKTDPALVGYCEVGSIGLDLSLPRLVAVGSMDRVYVAGRESLAVFSAEGQKLREIALSAWPTALHVAGPEHKHPGRIYLALGNHVEAYGESTRPEATWGPPAGPAMLTAIATGTEEVYAADATGRIVWRYDASGKLLGRIGDRNPDRNAPGFVIPSPYFDLVLAADGLLRVVNPGRHRIEAYTAEGSMELSWGKPSLGIEGFCGCCNPANIAILPDGRIVTAEKGIPRVKVYSADGRLESVVAGPEVLAPHPGSAEETRTRHKLKVFDVAVDSRGRVLVLDPAASSVRIFQSIREVKP